MLIITLIIIIIIIITVTVQWTCGATWGIPVRSDDPQKQQLALNNATL